MRVPKSVTCKAKAAHRKAQATYVAKNPKAQAARVKKSAAKTSTKGGSNGKPKGGGQGTGKGHNQPKGKGLWGHTKGRPRQGC